ncbi:TonB-dependent receptor [Sulfidibacter corallicola]|uniref:TonB-dependent receptor n=1 Tax=Sulfidibacter corallicola TaxID=2818388 RepID=A0A8A4TK66_SULCO|nr:TonB-dependent receptor [Sulfidibacter corallicola]QTD49973.1 TonB-dependent receptor [Sulfidibacter corallicola]
MTCQALVRYWVVSLCLLISSPSIAADFEDDFAEVDLSLEELLTLSITTASKIAVSAADAPGIVSVITREQIQGRGARTLADVLSMVPGITVARSLQNGYNTTILVRGSFSLNSEDILILKDGKRMNDAFTGGGVTFTPDYPVGHIKQIEIIRGPGSALYGANAFVGVINIITDRDQEDNRVSLRAGDHRGWFTSATLRRQFSPHARLGIDLDFVNNELEDIPVNGFSQFPEGPAFVPSATFSDRVTGDAKQMFTVDLFLEISRFTIGFEYADTKQRNNWGHGIPKDPHIVSEGVALDLGQDVFSNRDKARFVRASLKYERAFSDRLSLTWLSGYNDFHNFTNYRIGANASHGPWVYSGTGIGASFFYDRDTQTTFSDLSLSWFPSESHSLVVGLDYQRDEQDATFSHVTFPPVPPRDQVVPAYHNGSVILPGTRRILAAYAQHTWTPHEKLGLTLGARFDDYDDFGSSFNPRLAVVYHLSEAIHLKALYGEAFRAPSFSEKNQSFTIYIPNPDLEPEELETYELQCNVQPNKHWFFSLTGFQYDVDQVINQISTNTNPQNPGETQFRNFGLREGKGIEAELRYQGRQGHDFYVNFSQVEVEDILAGEAFPVSAIPERSLNAGFQLHFMEKRLSISANMWHRTDWQEQDPTSLPFPGIPGGVPFLETLRFEDATVVDLHGAYEIRENVRGSLTVINVGDAHPQFGDLHSFAPAGITTERRQVIAGINYRY